MCLKLFISWHFTVQDRGRPRGLGAASTLMESLQLLHVFVDRDTCWYSNVNNNMLGSQGPKSL